MYLDQRIARLEAARAGRTACPACGVDEGLVIAAPPTIRTLAEAQAATGAPDFCPACGRQTVFVIPSPSLNNPGARACA